jgi:hypothetical protein
MSLYPNYAKKSEPDTLIEIELGNKNFFVSYKKMKSLKIFDGTLSITSFNNVSFLPTTDRLTKDKKDKPSAIIEGPSFIISSRMLYDQYFHLIYDILAEIEIIKTFYPTLKIFFLNEGSGQEYKRMIKTFKNLKIAEAYDVTKNSIINLTDFSLVTLEQILFIFPLKDSIPSYLLRADAFNFSYPRTEVWGSSIKKNLSSRFLKNKKSPSCG